MLSYDEIKHNSSAANDEQAKNLQELLRRVNKVRAAWGKPMTVTSGLRTKADQIRIYKDKATKKQFPFLDGTYDENKVPMQSKHLFGAAVDIADTKRELQAWCLKNQDLIAQAGLWMESFNATGSWCHFQCLPYGSWKPGGSIFFNP